MSADDDFRPPSPREVRAALALLGPLYAAVRPRVYGLDGIPETRPLLFVGNHTLYGVLDVPVLFAELYRKRGIMLRALGDHAHFKVPVWGELLRRFGVVDGTRENCARLMRAGACVLVFPGGGREVAKRKGERYQLIWKQRLGFARLAIEHGCTIVPFASVGVEDAFDVIYDADDLLATRLGKWLARKGVRTDVIPPLSRGLGPTPLPRRWRQDLWFGPAIETHGYRAPAGSADDDSRVRALRDQVKQAVEGGIAELLERRAE